MSTQEKLSTCRELSTAATKKREGKKKPSPLSPFKEKGKAKEQAQGFTGTCSKPARAYARRRLPCTCSYDEAGAAAYEIVGNCFGTMGDLPLWAWYCRHFDRNRIVDKAYEYASMQRQGELRNALSAFQFWLSREFGAKEEILTGHKLGMTFQLALEHIRKNAPETEDTFLAICRNRGSSPIRDWTILDLAKAEDLSYESAKRRYNRHLKRLLEVFGVPPVG